jgi:hypothetical protein
VRQKLIAEHVQQGELGAETLGELGCPAHDLAADRRIIHSGENAPGLVSGAITYDQGRDGKAPNEALERPASAAVQALAPEYYEIGLEVSRDVSQTLDGISDAHMHGQIRGAERRCETTQTGERAVEPCHEPVVEHWHHWLQESRYFRNRLYVRERKPHAAAKVSGSPPGGCEGGLAKVHAHQHAIEGRLAHLPFSGEGDAIDLGHFPFSSSATPHTGLRLRYDRETIERNRGLAHHAGPIDSRTHSLQGL